MASSSLSILVPFFFSLAPGASLTIAGKKTSAPSEKLKAANDDPLFSGI
jgi:hypothetical protein